MILRVDVDSVAAMVEIESHESWTPEVLETLMRICGDVAVRTAIALGMEVSEEDEPGASVE